jgi:glycerate kinase
MDRWTDLHALSQVLPPDSAALFEELIVAVDVQNPLLGPQGCSRVYGPQKGLRPEEFEFADRCLGTLAGVLQRQRLPTQAETPGAGAAGGLGFGLLSFCAARLEPGFALFARHARLVENLRGADLVLTAEGSLDDQTLMGKGVGELGTLCQKLNVPCVAFAGSVPDPDRARQLFTDVFALAPDFAPKAEAMSRPAPLLETLAGRVARAWKHPPQ